jgi:peptide/nickel transport system ATP-binding protein
MEECWSTPPPKFLLDADRVATCFLYKDRPVSADADVSAVFGRPDGPSDPRSVGALT